MGKTADPDYKIKISDIRYRMETYEYNKPRYIECEVVEEVEGLE